MEENEAGKGQAWLSLPADQLLTQGLMLEAQLVPFPWRPDPGETKQHLGPCVSQASWWPAQTCPGPWCFPPSLHTAGSSRTGTRFSTLVRLAETQRILQLNFVSQSKRWISAPCLTASPLSPNCPAHPECVTLPNTSKVDREALRNCSN